MSVAGSIVHHTQSTLAGGTEKEPFTDNQNDDDEDDTTPAAIGGDEQKKPPVDVI